MLDLTNHTDAGLDSWAEGIRRELAKGYDSPRRTAALNAELAALVAELAERSERISDSSADVKLADGSEGRVYHATATETDVLFESFVDGETQTVKLADITYS